MRSRIITNAYGETIYVTIDGDMIDNIAFAYYGRHNKNTEALIEANPGLSSFGPILPAGICVKLPHINQADTPKAFRQLWN